MFKTAKFSFVHSSVCNSVLFSTFLCRKFDGQQQGVNGVFRGQDGREMRQGNKINNNNNNKLKTTARWQGAVEREEAMFFTCI